MANSIITTTVLFICVLVEVTKARTLQCTLGEFFKDGKCEECPPGTYQDKEGNSTKCKLCPLGTYNPYKGAHAIDICIECPAGTFRDKPGAVSKQECKKCEPGKASQPGSPKCISCPAGTAITQCEPDLNQDSSFSFRGKCFSCFFGASGIGVCEETGPVEPVCNDCDPRSFSGSNALECKSCPPGKFTSPGSAECVTKKCPPGSEVTYFGKCEKCFSFRFNDGSSDSCLKCPPGLTGEKKNGSRKCVRCPSGTYLGESGEKCRKCKEGENSSVTGAQFCLPDDTPCPPNFFKDRFGVCNTCVFQQRYDAKRNRCVSCPENHFSTGGIVSKCTTCPRGMISPREAQSLQSVRCFCKPGWGFVKGSNGDSCSKCPPGSFSDGSSSCIECFSQEYAPRAGMKQCLPCFNGRTEPRQGKTTCLPEPQCPKGLIRRENQECVDPKTNCPPYAKRIPQQIFEVFCKPLTCPPGTALLKITSFFDVKESCGVCFAEERYSPERMKCIRCRDNEISNVGLSKECVACPSGMKYSDVTRKCECFSGRQMKNGKCTPCPKGTFGFYDIEGCMPCPPGTFSSSSGSTECNKCKVGSFASAPASKSCQPCPKGTISFGIGETGCVRAGKLSR